MRLVLYAVAILIGGLAAILAWAWPEARLGFTTLGIGVVGTLWWAARRFPEAKRPHLLGAALVTLVAGLAGASYSKKSRRPRAREGWRSFERAFDSICRIRSRVTPISRPTSASVLG
jgi:hypothetical protein